jgi:hypothetical protein
MSPEGKHLRVVSGNFLLIGLLAGDIAFNVWYLVQARKREKAWDAALAEEVEKVKAADGVSGD